MVFLFVNNSFGVSHQEWNGLNDADKMELVQHIGEAQLTKKQRKNYQDMLTRQSSNSPQTPKKIKRKKAETRFGDFSVN
jgi:hypothetical protein